MDIMTTTIHTEDLIKFILDNPNRMIEARLCIDNVGATHFIYFNGKKVFDEGIDGENRAISKDELLKNYHNNFWVINNIV